MTKLTHDIDRFFTHLSMMEFEQCQSVLAQVEENASADGIQRWWATYMRGVLCNEQERDWDTSERLFYSLLQKDLPPDLGIRVQNALANTYQYLGRWQNAVALYQEILESHSQSGAEIERAKIFKNMAIAIEIGFSHGVFGHRELEQAQGYCELALSITNTFGEGDDAISWLRSTIWNTRGLISLSLQEWDSALACFEHYRLLSESLVDDYGIAAAQQNIGEVYQQQNKYEAARAMYEQALNGYRTFGDRYFESNVLVNLAELHYTQGRMDAALESIEQARSLSESIRVRLSAPTAQMGYRSTIEKLYRVLISVYLAQNDNYRAFTAAERARSRVLADLLLGQRRGQPSKIPAELVEERETLIEKIAQFDTTEINTTESREASLSDLERLLSEVDHQIELFDPDYALFDSVQSLDAQSVQKMLVQNSVLLSYTVDINDRIWAMVVTPDEINTYPIEKITATWLRSFLADHLDGVRQGVIVPDKAGYLSPPTLFPLLYKALIQPIASRLSAAETVYLIPAGPLHYIPLGALIESIDSTPLLMEKRRLIYAPSATVLFNFCQQRSASSQRGTLVVAPADEALNLTFNFARSKMGSGNYHIIEGEVATRTALLQNAAHHRVLCFLGHAIFDQHHPMSSRLKLVAGDLRASEILREMTLDADLVMLSACETGRNQILAGDEMLGLTRALFYAGTPALLTTLWPVHELPTLLLVNKILQAIDASDGDGSGWDPARYLSEAQLWLRNLTYRDALNALTIPHVAEALESVWQMTQPGIPLNEDDRPFTHPFFWAPYILVGE